MKRKDILDIAKYICFPFHNEKYREKYDNIEREVHFLPIISDDNVLYDKMPGNEHHYITAYTYTYVLPLLESLLHFGFDMNDFDLVPLKHETGDMSYLFPKKDGRFTLTCFTDSETVRGTYKDLFEPVFFTKPSYRPLYRYHHRCSRVINHSVHNDRKLMISGDSQSVPSIAPLCYYFKEVWYFDNRTGYKKNPETGEFVFYKEKFKSFCDKYKNTVFTDSIIQLYCRNLSWYEYWNLY